MLMPISCCSHGPLIWVGEPAPDEVARAYGGDLRRTRIRVAQGAAVAVAVVAVALTYLSPGDDPPLFGIDFPGREPSGQPPSGALSGPEGSREADRRENDKGSTAAGTGEPRLSFTGPPGASDASTFRAAPPAQSPIPATRDWISPADDQYTDVLGRLEAEFGVGR